MTRLPALLTTGRVAEILKVNPATVRRWVADRKIEAIILPSGQARIPRSAVESMLGEHAVEATEAEQVPA